jgi:hypothetical protein
MTLVVARMQDDDLFLVADSKVNDPKVIQQNSLDSILKIAILNPLVQLGYAGIIHYAEYVVREFYERKISNLETLIPLLWDVHVKSNQQTDFILCTAIDAKPRIFLIKDGELTHDINNAWIGDIQAFEVYQQNFLSSNEPDLKTKMKYALDSVSLRQSVDSVGLFTTCTLLDYKEHNHPIFVYEVETYSYNGASLLILEGETIELQYGSAEDGSYSISTMFSRSLGKPALGRYFEQIKLGTVHCPKISLYPIIFKNCTGEEFVRRAFEEYQIPLKGIILTQGTRIQLVDALEMNRY